jgi:23S rRNA (guanosine2251-2'-O)-methyltransferase
MERIVFGFHAIEAILPDVSDQVNILYVQKELQSARIQKILQLAKKQHWQTKFLTKLQLDELSQCGNHQGLVLQCVSPLRYQESDIEHLLVKTTQDPFVIVLDCIQDPHNLGACLRTANAVAADMVIIPKNNAVSLNATVCKVASGAAETTPLISVTNLVRTLQKLKQLGMWIYGFTDDATDCLYQVPLQGPIALVLGNEAQGMRRLTRASCDHLLQIPMLGAVNSLNVSVATAVAAYEVLRQRRFNN